MIWKETRAHDAPPVPADTWQRSLTIIDALLVVGLFAILPLEHTPGLRYLLCILLGLRGFWLLAKNSDHSFLERSWALGPWLAWASASYFWSVAPIMTLSNLKHDLWMPMFAFFGGYQLFRHRCPPVLLLWAVATGTVTNAIVTVFGAPLSVYPLRWANYYFSTVGYSSTYALYFSALALPWSFCRLGVRLRLLGLTVVILNVVVALINQNRMFFVAETILLLALFGVALRTRRLTAYATGAAAVALMALFIQVNQDRIGVWTKDGGVIASLIHEAPNEVRLKIWQSWAERTVARPMLGVGFGRDVPPTTLSPVERSTMLAVDPFTTMHSHNLFLNILLETGWVGLACFLLLLGQFVRQFLRSRLTSRLAAISGLLLLAAMVLKNQTDIFMQFGPAVLFYAALGILMAW